MHIIIPMSGIGKRFIDAGYSNPKPLIIVEGKPIIEHVINLFPKESKFTFICNDLHLKETNMREILTNLSPNCNIFKVSVDNRKGPVDAVLQAQELIDDNEPVIISYCDYGTKWNYYEFKKQIDNKDISGAIPCYIGFHPHMLGSDNYAFCKEENNYLLEIQEKKPFTSNKMAEYASNGTYYFKSGTLLKKYFKELVELNISTNNEFYVSMVYNLLVRDNLKVLIYEIEKMLQWGTPKDLEEYLMWSNYFLKRVSNFNKSFIDKYDTTLILPMAIKAVQDLPQTSKKIIRCQNEHLNNYKIKETILEYFNNTEILGINYVTEGQACTCELAFKNYDIPLDKPILISACDNGIYYDINKYNELVEDKNVDAVIFSFSNHPTSKLNPQMYAWLDVDEHNYIKRTSIKKPFNDCENKYAIIGTMFFKKASIFLEGLELIYKDNIRTNGEYYVDNLIEPLIKKGYKIKIFDVDYYLCWGTPNDYKTYNYWLEYFTNL